VLAQGQPSEDALCAMQELLALEEQQKLLLNAVRVERAGLHETIRAHAAEPPSRPRALRILSLAMTTAFL
jgi:hypothetical protein